MPRTVAAKISATVVGVVLLALLSSIVAVISAFHFQSVQETLISENVPSLRAAEELEIALLEQRGYVSSYILDNGNETWLQELGAQLEHFDYWLGEAKSTARTKRERSILARLEIVQAQYAQQREAAVELFRQGQVERARRVLLDDVAALYKEAYELCEELITENEQLVGDSITNVRKRVMQITWLIGATVVLTLVLGLALILLFLRGVILPLRRIAEEVRQGTRLPGRFEAVAPSDELHVLDSCVQLLLEDMATTRSNLEHSRVLLARAEDLAAVGRLAASVAHEIRNPLTSMKMWLYSLRRAIGEDEEARHKLSVVSAEITRLEQIIRNFLEFARPPALKLVSHALPPLIDSTLEVLKFEIEEKRIRVIHPRPVAIPSVLVDTEQLKQVLFNLIKNAVEAMAPGGQLRMAYANQRDAGQQWVELRISDDGPGIPETVRSRLFEPFCTTKPGGTGLGLCIAAAIVARHDGELRLEPTPSGTQWCIAIPAVPPSDSALHAEYFQEVDVR